MGSVSGYTKHLFCSTGHCPPGKCEKRPSAILGKEMIPGFKESVLFQFCGSAAGFEISG